MVIYCIIVALILIIGMQVFLILKNSGVDENAALRNEIRNLQDQIGRLRIEQQQWREEAPRPIPFPANELKTLLVETLEKQKEELTTRQQIIAEETARIAVHQIVKTIESIEITPPPTDQSTLDNLLQPLQKEIESLRQIIEQQHTIFDAHSNQIPRRTRRSKTQTTESQVEVDLTDQEDSQTDPDTSTDKNKRKTKNTTQKENNEEPLLPAFDFSFDEEITDSDIQFDEKIT